MIVAALRVVQRAQCDPAGEEFGVGEGGTLAQPVLDDKTIGKLRLTVGKRAAGKDLSLGPPRGWADEILRRVEQRLEGGIIEFLATAPARSLIEQARVVP